MRSTGRSPQRWTWSSWHIVFTSLAAAVVVLLFGLRLIILHHHHLLSKFRGKKKVAPLRFLQVKSQIERVELTFFFSSDPFFRSLLAMITPIRSVSNTGSVRFDCAANQTAPGRLSHVDSNGWENNDFHGRREERARVGLTEGQQL